MNNKHKKHVSSHKKSSQKLRSRWSARRYRAGSLSGPVFVELSFPTEDNATSRHRFSYSELHHPRRLLDGLSNQLPVYPADVKTSCEGIVHFVKELLATGPAIVELIPTKTGFIDRNRFASHGEIITADTRKRRVTLSETDASSPPIDIQGTPDGARDVLKVALYSNFLAFGFGVALAAPLMTYLKLHRKADGSDLNFTEGAAFNLSGRSSAGKSSVCRASLSLIGSVERAGSLDFTSRGLAETASGSNDLLLVLDDTETANHEPGAVVKALKTVTHTVTGGRSKHISKGIDQTLFPQLSWSTLTLSSSPRSIQDLARDHGWDLSPGDQVRLFNIAIPSADRGGIFDRLDGSATERVHLGGRLIHRLEQGYLNHSGHIFPKWIQYLLSKDRSRRIAEKTAEFIKHVGAEQGWERRFAQKFGIVYAAMMLGISAGLLPWHHKLPLEAATKCYRKARKSALSDRERLHFMADKLCRTSLKPNRTVNYGNDIRLDTPLVVPKKCIAIRYIKNGRLTLGVLDRHLRRILGSERAKREFTAALARSGVIPKGHGHAGSIQERLPIQRGDRVTLKPRLWPIDVEKLTEFTNKTSGRSQ